MGGVGDSTRFCRRDTISLTYINRRANALPRSGGSPVFRPRIPVRLVAMFALALILATAAYGFAASNTVPGTNAGDGSATISGYTVSAVHYTLNATNPANVDSLSFTIAPAVPAGGTVEVKLVAAGTTFKGCTVTAGTSVTCPASGTMGVTALQ